MNPVFHWICLLAVASFYSCSPTYYYQIYNVEAEPPLSKGGESIVYEDDHCRVVYDLWSRGGNIGFAIYNKSDEDLFLNMEESFFIKNGSANNYYRNRTWTYSSSKGVSSSKSSGSSSSATGVNTLGYLQTDAAVAGLSVSAASASGRSVSVPEEKIVRIPPKSYKAVSEYAINNTFVQKCGIKQYPTKSVVQPVNFTKGDSPFVFSNRISYRVGDGPFRRIEHEFYVAQITNYPRNGITTLEYEKKCGTSITYGNRERVFKESGADQFYVRYTTSAKNKIVIE